MAMSFAKAKRKLKKIAKGEHHSLSFETTESSELCGSGLSAVCRVYFHGCSKHHKGNTWEEAFASLDLEFNPPPTPTETNILSMAPKGEI